MSRDSFSSAFRAPRTQVFCRVLLKLAICYGLVVLIAAVFQRRLIYFPTRLRPETAASIANQEGFQPWRNNAGQIMGWRLLATAGASGAVLVVHGNAGSAVDRSYLAKPIHEAADVDVFVLEYPGYGPREGSPSLQSLVAAAEEAFDLLPRNVPRYIVSESLGVGVATHLAKTRREQVAGLMLFAPFNSLASVGQAQMPFLPVWLMLRDRFEPARWLKDYRGPVGIVLAERDEVIPARFGRRLHDDYPGPKRIETIPRATHNEIADQPPEWWRTIFTFWEKNGTARDSVQ